MNQPQGKQFRSVDSQRESRNQPAARAVRVLVPRSLRIRMLCLFTAYKAMGILSLVLRLLGDDQDSGATAIIGRHESVPKRLVAKHRMTVKNRLAVSLTDHQD